MYTSQLFGFIFILAGLLSTALVLAPAALAQSAETGTASTKSRYVRPGETLRSKATIYPNKLNGHKTASGERFHQSQHTAASNQLPLGTDVKVTNLKNGRSTAVKLNDHGPALGKRKIDLSKRAANDIGLTHKEGTAPVNIKVTRTPDGREAPPQSRSNASLDKDGSAPP